MAGNMLRFLLRRFFQRRDLERELNDELASHIALETARHVQDGESPEAARQIALREFGNMGLVAEVTRDQWGLGWLERALGDIRYSVRSFLRAPLFSAVVVITLGLGIGSSTTIFSLLDGILLRALPFPNSSQLMMLWEIPPHAKNECRKPQQFCRLERAQPFLPVHGGVPGFADESARRSRRRAGTGSLRYS